VKWYEIQGLDDWGLPSGEYVKAEDFDRERRRLLSKLCTSRAETIYEERVFRGDIGRRIRTSNWLYAMATALESGAPLTYFKRLGEDK
jgi:hypothetical protein